MPPPARPHLLVVDDDAGIREALTACWASLRGPCRRLGRGGVPAPGGAPHRRHPPDVQLARRTAGTDPALPDPLGRADLVLTGQRIDVLAARPVAARWPPSSRSRAVRPAGPSAGLVSRWPPEPRPHSTTAPGPLGATEQKTGVRTQIPSSPRSSGRRKAAGSRARPTRAARRRSGPAGWICSPQGRERATSSGLTA